MTEEANDTGITDALRAVLENAGFEFVKCEHSLKRTFKGHGSVPETKHTWKIQMLERSQEVSSE